MTRASKKPSGGSKSLLLHAAMSCDNAASDDESPSTCGMESDDVCVESGHDENVSSVDMSDVENDQDLVPAVDSPGPIYVKQRVLVCASRGINHRHRHLMSDIINLLPHSKKENKLDQKKNLGSLNELAELSSCNKVVYLESRHSSDLYLWMANAPNGPSIKFQVLNVHTMEELNMTGNFLKGSRSILSFDSNFDASPHTQIMKQLLTQIFNVPDKHRRSKPFFDHVLMFAFVDDKIWVRNYQTIESPATGTVFKPDSIHNDISLNEIGPRFVLNPIKLFQGSFGGLGLWENPNYLTPSHVRRVEKSVFQSKYALKSQTKVKQAEKAMNNVLPKDPLADVFV